MRFKRGETLIVVHFGELWLKGHNRNDYIRQLSENIREQLSGEKYAFERDFDRLIIRLQKGSDSDSIRSRLSKVFGISNFETSVCVEPTLAQICGMAKKMLARKPRARSLRISSHRSYKQHSFTSIDVVERLKKAADSLGIEPKTKDYERELSVSITRDVAFISLEKQKGAGGLPVGTSGKAIVLMSGGIDSPVAAWYAMKRGLVPVYVHLHGFQDAKEAREGKVPRIIDTLSAFYPHHKAYLVPSHIFQAGSFRYGKYELILLKAFMLRLAERIAGREGADVIYTGESLGQVASQTPENLRAEQQGVALPILRPLIGHDKEEIIRVARAIGTFDESTKPYKDVCSINSRNPKLRADPKEVSRMLAKMKIGSIVSRSLKLASALSA